MKNRFVFQIASFLAGVFLTLSFGFGQYPTIHDRHMEVYLTRQQMYYDALERSNWIKAAKIGLYENNVPIDAALSYSERPDDVQLGNEYWMPRYRAKILQILDSNRCLIRFDTEETFYLADYPTQNLFADEYIVLASPVVCADVIEGIYVLKFVPKKTLKERRGDALFDENQRKALALAGYREWELADGTKLWAKFDSVVKGGIVLEDHEGQLKSLKTNELSKKDAKFQIDEWKKHVREERKERAQKRKERDD